MTGPQKTRDDMNDRQQYVIKLVWAEWERGHITGEDDLIETINYYGTDLTTDETDDLEALFIIVGNELIEWEGER